MQNNSSKLTLSTLVNEFLNASHIRLVIFLSISFKYYFFIRIVFFLNILFFNFWEKRDVEREIVGENLGKREMWKRNSRRKFWEKRKQVRETIKNEMALSKVPLHVAFFFC